MSKTNKTNESQLSIPSLPCPSWLKQYLNYQRGTRNLATGTVMRYYETLQEFVRWTQAPSASSAAELALVDISGVPFDVIENVTQDDVISYLGFCADTLNNTAKTRVRKTAALRSFFKYYAATAKRLEVNPTSDLESPKVEKNLPKFLTESQIRMLLETAKNDPVTSSPERDYCMVVFLLTCGMRLSELVGINLTDIRDTTLTLRGKGRKERQVFLSEECMTALEDCKTERALIPGAGDTDALFLSRRGVRLTNRWVEKIVEKLLVQIGLDNQGYSVHSLRHSAASYQRSRGMDVVVIKEMLGHASLRTTEVYTHIQNEELKKQMENTSFLK